MPTECTWGGGGSLVHESCLQAGQLPAGHTEGPKAPGAAGRGKGPASSSGAPAGGPAGVCAQGRVSLRLCLSHSRRRYPGEGGQGHRRGLGGNNFPPALGGLKTAWWGRSARGGAARPPGCWSRAPAPAAARAGRRRLRPHGGAGGGRRGAPRAGPGAGPGEQGGGSPSPLRSRWPHGVSTCPWPAGPAGRPRARRGPGCSRPRQVPSLPGAGTKMAPRFPASPATPPASWAPLPPPRFRLPPRGACRAGSRSPAGRCRRTRPGVPRDGPGLGWRPPAAAHPAGRLERP